MNPIRILVVEDEYLIAIDVAERLQQFGYEVIGTADSAATARAILRTAACPDLVLMDICLRDGDDGIELAQQLQQEYPLGVIFLTSYTDPATLDRAKATTPLGYIVKPFQDQDLSTAVEIGLARHQAEQATKQALKRQRLLTNLKSHFTAVVTREFRTPLNSIKASTDLLQQRGDSLSEETRAAYFQRISASVQQMNTLLDEVLLISESEIADFQPRLAPVDVLWFCRDLVDELRSHLPDYLLLQFRTAAPEASADTDPNRIANRTDQAYYLLDTKLLRYILENLLTNAIQYSVDPGEVLFLVDVQAPWLTFIIQDSGIGIPEHDQPFLFEPFHRGSNVGDIAGTGLGLVIVKRCVTAFGGTIDVHSTSGGTRVVVTLPAEQVK
ncbi:MAG: response regulator [Kaiparowitsia implicata GSE-PSE-MK54-09C]|jgi:signal transduction histidine kinase|nr:response regulator [Kaiparowitsia implicata GSE-PSE-MK54-09C]